IEIDAQSVVSYSVNDAREAAEQAFIADALVVERRQHQHASTARFDRVPRQLNSVGQGASAGAGHDLGRWPASGEQLLQQSELLLDGEGVRLRIGAEDGESHLLLQ